MDTATIDMKILISFFTFSILILINGCSELDKSFQEPLPELVTYNSHIKAILDRSCVRCHGGSEQIIPNVDFTSYSQINSLIGTEVSSDSIFIVPGNPSSKLLRKTKPGGSMNLNLNDNRDYDLLYQWIVQDGALEN